MLFFAAGLFKKLWVTWKIFLL